MKTMLPYKTAQLKESVRKWTSGDEKTGKHAWEEKEWRKIMRMGLSPPPPTKISVYVTGHILRLFILFRIVSHIVVE